MGNPRSCGQALCHTVKDGMVGEKRRKKQDQNLTDNINTWRVQNRTAHSGPFNTVLLKRLDGRSYFFFLRLLLMYLVEGVSDGLLEDKRRDRFQEGFINMDVIARERRQSIDHFIRSKLSRPQVRNCRSLAGVFLLGHRTLQPPALFHQTASARPRRLL